jgi:hypothetical protein
LCLVNFYILWFGEAAFAAAKPCSLRRLHDGAAQQMRFSGSWRFGIGGLIAEAHPLLHAWPRTADAAAR